MSATETPSPQPRRRGSRLVRWLVMTVVILLVVIGLLSFAVRWVASGGLGASMLAGRLDGLSIGPAGELRLRGFEGDLLDTVQADRIELVDDEGVWLTITGLSLDWQPRSLTSRTVEIESLHADEAILHRLPRVEAEPDPEPPAEDGGGLPDIAVLLDALTVDRLAIEEDAFGQAAEFDVDASGALRRDRSGALHLQAIESGTGADRLIVDAQFPAGGDISVEVNASSEPGGLIAELIRAPEGSAARLELTAEGVAEEGDGEFALFFGADEAAGGSMQWTPDTAVLDARVEAARWPDLAALTERAGAAADIDLTLADYRGETPMLDLQVAAERLDLTATGPLPTGDNLSGPGLDVDATVRDLGMWTSGGAEASTAALSANVIRDAGGAFVIDGTLAAERFSASIVSADTVSGPMTLRFADGVLGFEGALETGNASSTTEIVGRLIGESPTLLLDGSVAFEAGELVMERAAITEAPSEIETELTIGFADGLNMAIEGDIVRAPLSAAAPSMEGVISGRFNVTQANAEAPFLIAAEGAVDDLEGVPAQAAEIVGDRLNFDLQSRYAGDTFTLERALVTGPRLRAGATGSLSPSAGYDIEYEAAVQGPIPAGGAELAGQAMARGAVTGAMEAPEITGQLFVDSVTMAGVTLERPVADFSVSTAEGLAGEAQLQAGSEYGPATAALVFATQDGVLTVPELSVDWADLSVGGGVRAGEGGLLTGALTVRKSGEGASPLPGALDGRVNLSGRGGRQFVDVEAEAGGLAMPERDMWLDRATITASGPLDRLDFTLAGEGVLRGVPVTASSEGVFAAEETGRAAEFGLNVKAGRVEVATETPVLFRMGPGGEQSLRARLALDEGRFNLEYDAASDGALIALIIEDAPIAVVEAARPEPRLDGELDAEVRLDTRGGGMSGTIVAALNDARALDAETENIDADLRGQIEGDRLNATLNMRTEDGMAARATLGLPLARGEGFVPATLVMDAPLSGRVTADGPIQTLTGLFLGAEQSLTGEIDLGADLSGSPGDPRISGTGGISGGAFDDAVSGLALRDLALGVRFSNDRVEITNLTANDREGGTIAGSGLAQSVSGAWTGQVNARLNEFHVVNRADASAMISGDIGVNVDPDERSVVGELQIMQAEFTPPASGPPGVRTIEVIEINAPGQEQDERIVGRRGPPTLLDISITADRRLFVRSSNMDVELSLNAHVGGTASSPTVSGEAGIVRGDVDLVGKRFTFTSGRARFNGDPLEANLDFSATRETSDLTAVIQVTGTPRAPNIALSSRPPLPQDEVLARVLFGRSATDLSALEAAQLAAALASMRGGGGFDALGMLRSGLGLDRLSVGATASGDPMVTGGRYLTDDVYLEVGTSAKEGAMAQVEWQALNNFAIISRFSSFGDSSLSVRWRTTY